MKNYVVLLNLTNQSLYKRKTFSVVSPHVVVVILQFLSTQTLRKVGNFQDFHHPRQTMEQNSLHK